MKKPNFQKFESTYYKFTDLVHEYKYNTAEKYRVFYGDWFVNTENQKLRSVNWSNSVCVQTDIPKYCLQQKAIFENDKMTVLVTANDVYLFTYIVPSDCLNIMFECTFNNPKLIILKTKLISYLLKCFNEKA